MPIKCSNCNSDNPDTQRFCGECGTQLFPYGKGPIAPTKTLRVSAEGLIKGTTFAGRYQIIEELGRGGMGVVYKAQDTKLKRTVALKFLPPEFTHTAEIKERFGREAQAAAALDHPHICTVYEFDEAEEKPFISMAYIEGQSIREKIKSGLLNLDEALNIALQVADGLKEAHKRGVVHRDIKSTNIMVTEADQAKIMDFGLARVTGGTLVTKEGMTMGTIAYMSPEQARGEKVDHRTDIWSLGVVLYEMLTGQLPFKGEHEQAVVYSILNEEPKPIHDLSADIPRVLDQVVNKALEKIPDERYQKIDELIDDLSSIKEGLEPKKLRARIIGARLSRRKRAILYAGTAGFLILLCLIILSTFIWRSEAIDSIAVLPLENLSGDPDKEYFSDGITDALINELAKISALRVISRTSIMPYKQIQKSLREIAQELDVDAVLEASVLTIGGRVQIRAQLIEARSEQNLWAQSYDRSLSDILVLQSEVAQAVASEIKVKLTPEEQIRLASERVVNPEAYELYLKGRYLWSRVTPQAIEKSIDYFKQAIEIDPMCAQAYGGLVEAYQLLGQMAALSQADFAPKAKEAAMRALELDETMGEVHTALGQLKAENDWDWEGAEREYKRAIDLSPNYAMTYVWYAQLLGLLGRNEEALQKIKKAAELDPLNPFISSNISWQYYYAGNYDRALDLSRTNIEMNPDFWLNHWLLGFIYSAKGMYEKAIVEHQKAVDLSDGSLECLPDLGYAYARADRKSEAQEVLKRLDEESKHRHVPSIFFAAVFTGLDEKDKAFEYLEKAYEEHDIRVPVIAIEPTFDSLRSDLRFNELLKKMRLEGVSELKPK